MKKQIMEKLQESITWMYCNVVLTRKYLTE
jgi:hypothetical protein